MRNRTWKAIIQDAAKREDEARRFFDEAIAVVHNPGARQLLRELAAEECAHKELLESLDLGDIQGQSLVALDDLMITEFLREKKIAPHSTPQDVLIVAMQLEKSAYDFYRGLAQDAGDPRVQQTLRWLAEEELKHKILLERQYDEGVYREN